MLANVGICFIFAPILLCFGLDENTMDKLQALRNESRGFCDVIKNKCKKYVSYIDKCFKQVYNMIKDTERRNR